MISPGATSNHRSDVAPESRLRLGLLVLFSTLSLVTLAAGGLLTSLGIGPWYRDLRIPWFQPPAWAFTPAWTIIFILLAMGSLLSYFITLAQVPTAITNFLEAIHADLVQTSPIFQRVSHECCRVVLSKLRSEVCLAKETLLAPGQLCSEVYIVVRGVLHAPLPRRALDSFEVIRKGFSANGLDDGSRPIHLVLVASAFARLLGQVPPTQPMLAARIARLLIALARAFLIEFREARQMV